MTHQPDPTRFVADVDVLVADVFVNGKARQSLDHLRANSWLQVYTSTSLIDETVAVITALADADLATTWQTQFRRLATIVDHPERDHPALGTAYAARAAHLLTYDERLRTPQTGVAMRRAMPISIRDPAAFIEIFDAAALYEATFGEAYDGPDVDPRS